MQILFATPDFVLNTSLKKLEISRQHGRLFFHKNLRSLSYHSLVEYKKEFLSDISLAHSQKPLNDMKSLAKSKRCYEKEKKRSKTLQEIFTQVIKKDYQKAIVYYSQ